MKTQGYFLGIPYDFRWPTRKIFKERFWNPKDQRLFTPHVFGWGYSLNFYELLYHRKNLFLGLVVIFILALGMAVYNIWKLDKAHSTFENYYAFRGCAKLLERTADSGLCETNSGKEIKIVKFKDKWYLDGDLPCGFLCF